MEIRNEDRLVVVSFDAATCRFSVNPNPVRVHVNRTLYFALQTANRGESDAAVFTAIFEDHALCKAKQVEQCRSLWSVQFQPADVGQETAYAYTVRICYDGRDRSVDPSVVLLPTPPPVP